MIVDRASAVPSRYQIRCIEGVRLVREYSGDVEVWVEGDIRDFLVALSRCWCTRVVLRCCCEG